MRTFRLHRAERLTNAHAAQVEYIDAVQILQLSRQLLLHSPHLTVHQNRHAPGTQNLILLLLLFYLAPVGMANLPRLQTLLKEAVRHEVVIIRYIIGSLLIEAAEPLQAHFYARLQALARLRIEELAHAIQIVQVSTEALQPSEQIRTDARQVTRAPFQRMFRISFLPVQDIHVRRVVTHRHKREQTLALLVRQVVSPYKRVILMNQQFRRTILHLSGEVVESHPVKPFLPVLSLANAHSRHVQLVRLCHVPVVFLIRVTVILLYEYDIIHAEWVVQPAPLRLQVNLSALLVVMVHLHHVAEEAVTVLSQQLRDNHLKHAQGIPYRHLVYLQMVFYLNLARSVRHLLFLDGPPEATKEGRYEFRAGEIPSKRAVTLYFEGGTCHTVVVGVADSCKTFIESDMAKGDIVVQSGKEEIGRVVDPGLYLLEVSLKLQAR